MATHLSNIIQTTFKHKAHFTKDELEKLLLKYFPDYSNENTFNWRIHDLKKKGVIQNFARGIYSLADKKEYQPDISREAIALYKRIQQGLPYTTFCIIDTKWFNAFMLHQVFKTYLIIEVEKEAASTVFNRIMETGGKVFLNPGTEIFENYIASAEGVIIVKSLISESPVVEQEGIKVASLEKMLVDCLCDKEIYGAQFQEADFLFKSAVEKHPINISKLKRYARRRNKAAAITRLTQTYLND